MTMCYRGIRSGSNVIDIENELRCAAILTGH